MSYVVFFFFSSRRRHTRWTGDWSSDVCSSDLGGGRMSGGMSDDQRARMRQTMELAFTAPASLEIAAGDSSVTLVADGDKLALTTDGRKVRREAKVEGEGAVDIKARWQGNDLVVERSVSGGGKVSEDYMRSSDGKQLYV